MNNNNAKNNKGITLTVLVLTIVISLILIVSISTSFRNVSETQDYYKKKEDIIALTKAAQSYYLREDNLPLKSGNIKEEINFYSTITNYNGGIDRNPNDNDRYYVIYSPEYKDTVEEYLTEVNIRSTESTYLINERSLTIYCLKPFLLDGKMHYTASANVSGARFASDYYHNLGAINQEPSLEIDTRTIINVRGKQTNYSTYAHKDSIVELKIDIGSKEFHDADGNIKSDVSFQEFERKPSENSFKMKITTLDGTQTYEENIPATQIITYGKSCIFKFDLSKINTNGMKSRRKLTFSYDESNEFYYNSSNKVDYDDILTSYQELNSFEFENSEEEIIIASEMNKASGNRKNFLGSIRKISTNSKNWSYYTTYTDIITTSSGQKYIIKSNAVGNVDDFGKAHKLTLNIAANPDDIDIQGKQIQFNINGITYNTSTYEIDVEENTKIGYKIAFEGFHIKEGEFHMGSIDMSPPTITVNAVQYTFTLAIDTDVAIEEGDEGFTLVNNTTHRSHQPFKYYDKTNTSIKIDAYKGDVIQYNIGKDFYRYGDKIGTPTKNTIQTYTMPAMSYTKNISLVRNIASTDTSKLKVETKCVWKVIKVDRSQQSKTATLTYTNSPYYNVLKVDALIKYGYDVWSSKGININVTFNNSDFNSVSQNGWAPDKDSTTTFNVYQSNTYPPTYTIPSGSKFTTYQKQNYDLASSFTTNTYLRIHYAIK